MKVVKKVAKGVRNVFRGVKKVFKKVTKSKFGKALLVAGAIYLGGAALGAWSVPNGVPFASKINGAFVGGSKASAVAGGADVAGKSVATAGQAGTAATNAQKLGSMVSAPGSGTTATLGSGASMSATVPGSALPAALNSPVPPPTAPVTPGAVSPGAKWNSLVAKGTEGGVGVSRGSGFGITATGAPGTLGPQAGAQGASKGLIGKLGDGLKGVGKYAADGLKGVGKYAAENPVPTMIGLNAASSMASPDEIDIMNYQRDYENERMRERNADLDVSNINLYGSSNPSQFDLNAAPTPRRFSWQDGAPVFERGLIGGRY